MAAATTSAPARKSSTPSPEATWKHVEKAAGASRRPAEKALKALQSNVDEGSCVPTSMTVLELGRKWLREHVQPNLRPGAAAN